MIYTHFLFLYALFIKKITNNEYRTQFQTGVRQRQPRVTLDVLKLKFGLSSSEKKGLTPKRSIAGEPLQ